MIVMFKNPFIIIFIFLSLLFVMCINIVALEYGGIDKGNDGQNELKISLTPVDGTSNNPQNNQIFRTESKPLLVIEENINRKNLTREIEKGIGFVTVSGKSIFDINGNRIFWRGVNWEDPKVCNEKDIEICKEWGVNLIRVWCYEENIGEGVSGGGEHFQQLLRIAKWAEENEIYILPVLGTLVEGAANKSEPWNEPDTEKRMINFWISVATQLKDNKYVAGYELWNEPSANSNEIYMYHNVCRKIISAIHTVDKNHSICISATHKGNIEGLQEGIIQNIGNIFYTFHFYYPYEVTLEKKLKYPGEIVSMRSHMYYADLSWMQNYFSKAAFFRDKYNIPLLLGEFGCMASEPDNSVYNWVRDVILCAEQNHFPWCFWEYKSDRGFSMHLYYNEVDKMSPPKFILWTEMFNILQPYFQKNQ